MEESVSLRPYLSVFTAAYIVTTVAVSVIPLFLEIELPTALGAIIVMVCGIFASQKFVTDQQRVFTKRERWIMVIGSLLISTAVSVLFLAILAAAARGVPLWHQIVSAFQHISIPIFVVIFSGLILIYVLMLQFAYGWMARKLLEAAQKKAAGG